MRAVTDADFDASVLGGGAVMVGLRPKASLRAQLEPWIPAR